MHENRTLLRFRFGESNCSVHVIQKLKKKKQNVNSCLVHSAIGIAHIIKGGKKEENKYTLPAQLLEVVSAAASQSPPQLPSGTNAPLSRCSGPLRAAAASWRWRRRRLLDLIPYANILNQYSSSCLISKRNPHLQYVICSLQHDIISNFELISFHPA